jgi:hypothetical protein
VMLLSPETREIFRSKKNNTIAGVVWTLLLPVSEMCSTNKPSATTIFADQKFALFWWDQLVEEVRKK